jgi:hypothetical protein
VSEQEIHKWNEILTLWFEFSAERGKICTKTSSAFAALVQFSLDRSVIFGYYFLTHSLSLSSLLMLLNFTFHFGWMYMQHTTYFSIWKTTATTTAIAEAVMYSKILWIQIHISDFYHSKNVSLFHSLASKYVDQFLTLKFFLCMHAASSYLW